VSCTRPIEAVHAYLDGELDASRTVELEEHVRGCARCAQVLAAAQGLRDACGVSELRFTAPGSLHERIREDVRRAARRERSAVRLVWRGVALAMPLAAAAMIALAVLRIASGPRNTDPLLDEVVSSHVRSLMASHLTDVATSDKHTVKPWFDGKLDFSPTVVDLADRGFPLAGGRLDYLDGRPVAALVYERHKHLINLFVWPNGPDAPERITSERGFSLVHWSAGGMTYWAVSDLNAMELGELTAIFRDRAAAQRGGG
jgi:anti-sigma factor RsiW